MKIVYIAKNFRKESLDMIGISNDIINKYSKLGYSLTLRQLYYQFIAHDLFPEYKRWRWTGAKWVKDLNGTKNAIPNYKWLATIISNGRLAGLIDWDSIEDRTRNLSTLAHWGDISDFLHSVGNQYRFDLWRDQEIQVEVWVEKEALSGIIEPVCKELDVPFFACMGYVSQSAQWNAGRRALRRFNNRGQRTVILHLGDHDPSGIDMTRDNNDRLSMFSHRSTEVIRIALNMDQVEEYNPPPNPAKATDARFKTYRKKYGTESWELDALEPSVISDLITSHVNKYIDHNLMAVNRDDIADQRTKLIALADKWDEISETL